MDSISKEELIEITKQVLKHELEKDDKFMDDEDLNELLNDADTEAVCRDSIFGYPSRPLYRDLAERLFEWMQANECPVLKLPKYNLLDERDHQVTRLQVFNAVTPLLQTVQSLWNDWFKDEKLSKIREILFTVGKRGLLDMLGLRKTVGSFDYWPPPRSVIEKTFQAKRNERSDLTVGARALAKHCHRDTSSWWGVCTGTEKMKNEHASEILNKILDGATWINIHQLPHDVRIVEVRQENGYGARWTSNGDIFRGFLEPQMVDGHEVGWKH